LITVIKCDVLQTGHQWHMITISGW